MLRNHMALDAAFCCSVRKVEAMISDLIAWSRESAGTGARTFED